MTRQDVMKYVGKFVRVCWNSDGPRETGDFLGVLALHKEKDWVCVGHMSRVYPCNVEYWPGYLEISELESIFEEKWMERSKPSFEYQTTLHGALSPFDKRPWLVEPVQEVSKSVQASSMWNAVCPHCGAVAYISCFSAECSNAGCSFGKR